jgi:proline dehydrogenase
MQFSDTKVAYQSKTDKELKRALLLFQLMKNPVFSKIGVRSLRIMMKMGIPIQGIVKAVLFNHFIGGETLQEGSELINRLNKVNMNGILDFATEDIEEDADVDDTLNELCKDIRITAENKHIPFAVFKPSALTSVKLLEAFSSKPKEAYSEKEHQQFNKMVSIYDKVFSLAHELNVPLMIDAEESWTQQVVDDMAMLMIEKYNKNAVIAINTYQLYRKDRLDYLKYQFDQAKSKGLHFGAKLVRGAYMEKERKRALERGYESPIFNTKEQTDQAYNDAQKFCIDHHKEIMLFSGTHNQYSNEYTMQLMKENGLPANHPNVWISQLYGMCDHISYCLAGMGYNVCKYIPYGKVKIVTPYLLRRAEENSSVTSHVPTEIRLIKEEIKRRNI